MRTVERHLWWKVLFLLLAPIVIVTMLGLPVHTMRGGDDVNFALRLAKHAVTAIQNNRNLHGWDAEGNNGFGSPVFYFYGFLPSLLTGCLTIALHLTPAAGVSLAAALFRVGAFGTSFLWLRQQLSTAHAAVAALLFVSLPFTFLENPFVRFAFAEMLATALLPLCFYAVDKEGSEYIRCLRLASITPILAITHLPQTSLMLLSVVLYAFVRSGWRTAASAIFGGTLGLLIAGFFVYPALTLQGAINASAWTSSPFMDPSNNFLFDLKHLRLNRYQVLGEICLHTSWLVAFGFLTWSIWASSWRVSLQRLRSFPVVVTLVVTLVGMTDLSWLAWTKIHFLHQLQFSWRLMPICMLMTTGAAAVSLRQNRLKPRHLLAFIALLVSSQTFVQLLAAEASVGYLGVLPAPAAKAVANRIPDYVSWQMRELPLWASTAAGAPEYVPKAAVDQGWSLDMGPDLVIKNPPLAESSLASPSTYRRTRNGFRLLENPDHATTFVLPQFFFPGWGIAQKQRDLDISQDARTGLLKVGLPAGRAQIDVIRIGFSQTQIGDLISITGLTAFGCLAVFIFVRSRANRAKSIVVQS